MKIPRVFVSHGGGDTVFTERLVKDLRSAGLEIWIDYEHIASSDQVSMINEGLGSCQWVILVMSPSALESKWVSHQVNAAVNLKTKRRINAVLPIEAEDCSQCAIPPIWASLHTFNGRRDYNRSISSIAELIHSQTPHLEEVAVELSIDETPTAEIVIQDPSTAQAVEPDMPELEVPALAPFKDTHPLPHPLRTSASKDTPLPPPAPALSSSRRWIRIAITGLIAGCLLIVVISRVRSTPKSARNPSGDISGQSLTTHLVQTLQGPTTKVVCVRFLPDGSGIGASCGKGDDAVYIWGWNRRPAQVYRGAYDGVRRIAFSRNGTRMIGGSRDHNIYIWDVRTGRQLQTLNASTNVVRGVALSPDGYTLVSGGLDKSVTFWNANGSRRQSFQTGAGDVNEIAFSPEGNLFAVACSSGVIQIWDALSMRIIRSLAGHTGAVQSVSFPSRGNILASGGEDRTVKLWDIASGRELHSFAGHRSGVLNVAFSPNGNYIASASDEGAVIIWNAFTQRLATLLRSTGGAARSVAFSPTQKDTLAVGTLDGRVNVWTLSGT